MAEFKDMLRYFREQQGLSQTELGKKVNLSTSAIGMYERDERTPRDSMKVKLAKFYKVSIESLFFS